MDGTREVTLWETFRRFVLWMANDWKASIRFIWLRIETGGDGLLRMRNEPSGCTE